MKPTTEWLLRAALLVILAGCASPDLVKVPVRETPYDDRLWDLNRQLCLEAKGVWIESATGWECRGAEKPVAPPLLKRDL